MPPPWDIMLRGEACAHGFSFVDTLLPHSSTPTKLPATRSHLKSVGDRRSLTSDIIVDSASRIVSIKVDWVLQPEFLARHAHTNVVHSCAASGWEAENNLEAACKLIH